MEAPEFLRDECMVLRSAFGYGTTHAWINLAYVTWPLFSFEHTAYELSIINRIQKFLLHPRHKNQDDGKHAYDKDETCTMKARKIVKQIEIEGMNQQPLDILYLHYFLTFPCTE
jgi:hypothetical protein